MQETNKISKVNLTEDFISHRLRGQIDIFINRIMALIEKKSNARAAITFIDMILLDNSSSENLSISYNPEIVKPNEKLISQKLASIAHKKFQEEWNEYQSNDFNLIDSTEKYIMITSLFEEEMAKNMLEILDRKQEEIENKKLEGDNDSIIRKKQIEKIRHKMQERINELNESIRELEGNLKKQKREIEGNKNRGQVSKKGFKKNKVNTEEFRINAKIKMNKNELTELNNGIVNFLKINKENAGPIKLELIKEIGDRFKVDFNTKNKLKRAAQPVIKIQPAKPDFSKDADIDLNLLKRLYEEDTTLKYLYACKGTYLNIKANKKQNKNEDTYVKFIIVIGFDKADFSDNTISNYINIHETSVDFESIVSNLIYDRMSSSYEEILESARTINVKNATRAAIAQVMSRSGSHNIGSHVLSDYVIKLAQPDYNFYTEEVAMHTFSKKKEQEGIGANSNKFQYGKNIHYFGVKTNFFPSGQEPEESFKIFHEEYKIEVLAMLKSIEQAGMMAEIRSKKIVENKELFKLKGYSEELFLNYENNIRKIISEENSIEQYTNRLEDLITIYSRKLQSRFSSYIKTRMDFQSDIATTTPTLQNSKFLIKDIFKDFDSNRILLNRISGLENFKFFINVIIKTNGRCDSRIGEPCQCISPNGAKRIHQEDDILISMPNDIVGCQALYILLENIIRNTAKHSRPNNSLREDVPHVFTIEIREPVLDDLSDFYEVYIYDDFEKKDVPIQYDKELKAEMERKCKKYDEMVSMDEIFINSQDFLYKEQRWASDTFNINEIDELVINQNIRLNENIIFDKSFDLRIGTLGLVEMKVAATYLRKKPVEQCERALFNILPASFVLPYYSKQKINFYRENKEEPYLLKAVNIDNRLGYRLYLIKPVHFLVILATELLDYFKEIDRQNLRRYGISVIGKNQFMDSINEKEKIYNHEFLIYVDPNLDEILKSKNNYGLFPYRQLLVDEKILKAIFVQSPEANKLRETKETLGLLERYCWQLWVSISNEKKLMGETDGDIVETFYEKFRFGKLDTNGFFNLKNSLMNTKCQILGLDNEAEVNKNNQSEYRLKSKRVTDVPYIIKYLNHGSKESWNNKGMVNFAQPASNSTQICLPNYSSLIDEPGYHLNWSSDWLNSNVVSTCKIIESCMHNIGVIDERVQHFSKKKISDLPPFYDVFSSMNILQPHIYEVDLNTQGYTQQMYSSLLDWFKKHLRVLDSIIIHITVLERCTKFIELEMPNKEFHPIEFFVEQHIRNISPHINLIFTSGRGKPPSLPANEKYLPFSIVSEALLEKKSKYTLLNSLVNARKLIKV